MPGNKSRRTISVGNPTCLLGFPGRDSVDSAVFDSSTLQPGGVDEVQTATVAGTPTGGTVKFGYKGQTTANIAYNATGATVQTELRKLSRLSPELTVSGGAGGPWVISFKGQKLGKQPQPLITLAANNLTGGTSPTVGIVRTTAGDDKFAGLYVLQSGLPLMANAAGDKVVEWDYGDPADLVGIFDGQREIFPGDDPIIPVYNHGAVFDKAVVKNYAANAADFETWAAGPGGCQFKSQGS